MDPTTWGAPFPIVVAALFGIVMARANGTYWLGRAAAAGTERSRLRHLIDSKGYRDAAAWIDRWGPPAVTVSFLTIGVQTLVNLAAGVMRMPLRHYLPVVVAGSVVWAFIYATIGFVGVSALTRMWELSPVSAVVIAVVVVGGICWWAVTRLASRAVEQ